jgi:O-antigen/teichoic acid export membrane protein
VFEFLQRSEFAKNIFILVSGSTIAQTIPLLAEPILSRIFTPEEFGVFEIYLALVSMLGVIGTARYEMAVILPRTENKAVNVLGLALFFGAAFSLLILLLFYLGSEWVLSIIPAENFGPYLFYVPLGIFLLTINRGMGQWQLRQKQMQAISYSKVTESSTKAGSSILLGTLNFSSLGLIWGQLSGTFFAALYMFGKFLRTDRKKSIFLSMKQMLALARKYSEFPKINVPIALSEVLQISGVIFVFSFYFDTNAVGEFSKALRILFIPIFLISTPISQAFYQKASRDYLQGKDISADLRRIVFNLLKWSVLPLIVFVLISPWLFGFVLGPLWVTAGEYARILVFWVFLRYLTLPVSLIPLIIDRQRIYLLLNLIGNAIMIASIVIPGTFGLGVKPTLIILSFFQGGFVIFLYLKVLSIYRSASTKPTRD